MYELGLASGDHYSLWGLSYLVFFLGGFCYSCSSSYSDLCMNWNQMKNFRHFTDFVVDLVVLGFHMTQNLT